ncbi:MAG: lamin tail domain-containing protein, partial [Myxococcota bacterium]|nr:lamin tail domain-containing protein [Myxococcota bacterium]
FDGDECTDDLCNEATGECVYAPLEDCCETSLDCDDGDSCTTDSCDVGTGACKHVAISGCCQTSEDCDDNNPATIDTCDNNTCVHVDDPEHCYLPETSAVVINELMIDSGPIPDTTGEYIELYNASGTVIDLLGWKLETASGTHTINEDGVFGYNSTKIVPGGIYLMARATNPATDGLLKPHYVYDGVAVELHDPANGLDTAWALALRDDAGEIVDTVAYDPGWPIIPGHSMELVHPYVDNADKANWVAAGQSKNAVFNTSYSYTVTVKGSPKQPNMGAYRGITDGNCPVSDEAAICGVGLCDMDGRCQEGHLEGCCTTNTDCQDFNPCTVSVCDTDNNVCSPPVTLDGCCATDADCVDDNPCNYDRCIAGICRWSPNVIPNCCTSHEHCEDGDACTTNVCDLVSGNCHEPEDVILPAGQTCCNSAFDCDDETAATDDFCLENICSNPPAANFCLS